jgi:hypothetical protein
MAKGEEGAMPVWTSSDGNVDQIGRTGTERGGEGVYMQGGDSKSRCLSLEQDDGWEGGGGEEKDIIVA